MVSRRIFFSILTMMAVLLFLFQVPEVVKETQSDYDVNSYVHEVKLYGRDAWEQKDGVYEDGDFVVFFGDAGNGIGRTVEQWCFYTKRNLQIYDAFDNYSISEDCIPEAILVDCDVADPVEGFPFLEEATGHGITLIFCNLPEPDRIKESGKLRELLGIQSVREEKTQAEGIRLFGNFLLGGEAIYVVDEEDKNEQRKQDMELDVPWFVLMSGTKTYMVATLDKLLEAEEDKNELFPSLIWRNAYQGTFVFAVNGDYMERTEGIGILDSMIYETSDYSLYPVVNAQNVSVLNYPSLAGENDETVMELYWRSTEGVLRDICWPSLSVLEGRSHFKLTCLLAAQFDYVDEHEPSGRNLSFYLQLFKEFESEAGISLDRLETTDFSEKIIRDEAFIHSLNSSYSYSAFFVRDKDLERMAEAIYDSALFVDIRTVTSEYQENKEVVSYYTPDVTRQNITANAAFHSYLDDLRLRSLETALGYSNVLIDMYTVIWPETEEDQWEKMSKQASDNLNTYWGIFEAFDKTTLSESDERIRTFLNLDYRQGREDDTIFIEISGPDSGWFILRTHGEKIVGMDGGTYVEIEGNAYLINVVGQNAKIHVERLHGALKYTID